MFIIDFGISRADILSMISNRDYPAWTIPVFDFIKSWLDESINSFEVQTSGSTGSPKLIIHSREAMIESAERTCVFFKLQKNNIALLALPATHIGGKMMIVRSIIRGLKLICIEPKSDPSNELSFDGKIDFAAFTPMQMSKMLNNSSSNEKLIRLKQIILGGGEISYPLRHRLQDIYPSVYETYGMTETVSHIALKKINGANISEYFTILNGIKISADERGCLVIEAPHLSSLAIITNDIVNIISEKQFQWLGRYDNIINTGGIKVSAEEIERKLQPYIKEIFFIAGRADDTLGQIVSLIIETNNVHFKLPNNINSLNKFEKPRQILTMEKFVYTENGKINKKDTLKKLF